MILTFQKEDFIGNNFYSNTDCAICRAASRQLGTKVTAAGWFFSTWTEGTPYSGRRLKNYSIPLDYGSPEFERAKKAVAKEEFVPFSIEVHEITDFNGQNMQD